MLNAVACSLMTFSGFPVFLDDDGLVLTHMAGVVRDADHKPIARASVSLTSTLGHYETRRNTLGTGHGVSDAEGHYRLSFFTKLGGAVDVLGAKAEARGFVRSDLWFPKGKLVMKPGETTEFISCSPKAKSWPALFLSPSGFAIVFREIMRMHNSVSPLQLMVSD